MNAIDLAILHASNRLVGRVPAIDDLVLLLSQNDLVKGGVFLAATWWLWTQPHPELRRRRDTLAASALGAVAAAAVSRAICRVLPFHTRPHDTPGLALAHAFPAFPHDALSSLPSDHAALAFGLVAGFLVLSRRLGLALAAYGIAFVCLPRLYVGLHWPSDLALGAAIGLTVSGAFCAPAPRAALGGVLSRLHDRAPGAFYAAMFLVSFGLVTRFDDARELGRWAARSAHGASTAVALKAAAVPAFHAAMTDPQPRAVP
jgi:membrane-associated phospholipid phosphatase